MGKIVNRKKNWVGHVLTGGALLRDVMEGHMEGERGRGRMRKGMLDELMKEGYETMTRGARAAQNRDAWREWMPWIY